MSLIVTDDGGVVSIAIFSETLELSLTLFFFTQTLFFNLGIGAFATCFPFPLTIGAFLRVFGEGSLIFTPCCAGLEGAFLFVSFERALGDEKSNFLLTPLFWPLGGEVLVECIKGLGGLRAVAA